MWRHWEGSREPTVVKVLWVCASESQLDRKRHAALSPAIGLANCGSVSQGNMIQVSWLTSVT